MTWFELSEILLRITLSMLAGIVVGSERQTHGRAAGLRTTVLVAVAACVAMILSQNLLEEYRGFTILRADPARLAAGILTGMGFLGAGTIMRHQNIVRGVTTAALLWFVTILGLAFGAGQLILGLIGLALVLLSLFVLPHVESRLKSDWYATLTITTGINGLTEEAVRQRIKDSGITINNLILYYNVDRKRRIIRCHLKLKRPHLFELSEKLVHEFASLPDVHKVKWS